MAWFGNDNPCNIAVKVPEELAGPGAGEIGALLVAISSLQTDIPIHIHTRTSKLQKDLTSNLTRLEDTNWVTHPNSSIMKVLIAKLRARSALTTLSDWEINISKEMTDRLQLQGTESLWKDKHDDIPTVIDTALELTSMKLSTGSQKRFYQNIRLAKQPAKQRRRTTMNMAMAIHAAQDIFGQTPSSKQVWSSIRDCDTPKNIQGFLWKCLHRAYKIGEFLSKIPHFEQRGTCNICDIPETMKHILLECESAPQGTIWKAAQELWFKREANWPRIHFGTILGCNLAKFCNDNRKKLIGKSRLFKIIVLESAHLIWKLRCERVIKYEGKREKFHSETEVYNRWVHTMNTRLKFDHLLTDSSRYSSKALKIDTVLKTWSGVLKNKEHLPDNWVHKSEVLVDMAPCRPPGWNR
ncbi:hypothetical protein EDD22DRAFT_780618 [Suillus occidentalis]|nr:hypothetical protein EDD22DRAFT_780618 [Suillus occidentalis]